MATDRGNMGKKTEAAVFAWLTARSNADAGFAWHRLPDSRSARGAIAAQPSDALVVWKGVGSIFIEIKETKEVSRLPKAKIGQYGILNKMDAAGALVRVVVYLSTFDKWVVLGNSDLFCHEVCPPSFSLRGRSYPTLEAIMTDVFGYIDTFTHKD